MSEDYPNPGNPNIEITNPDTPVPSDRLRVSSDLQHLQLGKGALVQEVEVVDIPDDEAAIANPEVKEEIAEKQFEVSDNLKMSLMQLEATISAQAETAAQVARSIANIKDEWDMVARRFRQADSEGPWSGNYLRDHRQLIQQAETVISATRSFIARLEPEVRENEQKNKQLYMNVEGAAAEDAKTTENPEVKKVLSAVEDQTRHIVMNLQRLGVSEEDLQTLKLIVNRFDGMVSSRGTETVGDALGPLLTLSTTLEELQSKANLGPNATNQARIQITEMKARLKV